MRTLAGVGGLLCHVGMGVEILGVLSLTSRQLRMALPFKSPPFALQSIGVLCFVVGVLMILFSEMC